MVAKNTGSGVTLPRFTSKYTHTTVVILGRTPGSLCKMGLCKIGWLSEVMHVSVKCLAQCLTCSKCSVNVLESNHYHYFILLTEI